MVREVASKYTSIKVGVANGYICVALLKQICVIADPSAISPYPGHFWFVRRAVHRHTECETTITQTEVRRGFMRYPQLQAFVVSVTAPGKATEYAWR